MIWIGRLISFATVLQTIEFFWIRPYRADLLTPEIPKPLRWILRCHPLILALRLVAGALALAFPSPAVVAVLLVTTWLIAIRWRGTFNGGSDIMTFHILAAWLVSLCIPSLERACVFYVAIQLSLSYFVAGVAKINNPAWRSGLAVQTLLQRWGYPLRSPLCRTLSFVTLLFETLFPLALLSPWPFLLVAALFHLANVYVFGLNRFFFVWLAGYPAIFFLAEFIHLRLQ